MERIIRVLITPGHTALTRMPAGANSIDADFVIPMTACLLAPYAINEGVAISPAAEAVLMMDPPPLWRIASAQYRIPSQTPFIFTCTTRSKISSS